MTARLEWELLDDESSPGVDHDIATWRARVHGGWLVSVWAKRTGQGGGGQPVEGGANWGGGLTFVPDPERCWNPATK